MKVYFLMGLLALVSAFTTQAQQFEPIQKTGLVIVQQPQPLVVVNDQETSTHALILHPDDIKSIEVVKGAQALERFGDKAADGAVLIDLKQELPLARLEEVYKAFHIPRQQQKLTLAINGKHVKDPHRLLADLRQIEKIEVADFDTAPARWSFDAQYLNIVTKPQR